MSRITAITLVSLLIVGCGGSDASDLATRHGLQAQAVAWENRMPRAIDGTPSCTPLIVRFAIRAGANGFPQGLKAESVSLSKFGTSVWEEPVSEAETGYYMAWTTETDWLSTFPDGGPPPGKSERILSGVARGCASPSIAVGEMVTATIQLTSGGEQAAVSAIVKLDVAS